MKTSRQIREACYSRLPALKNLPRNQATEQLFELTYIAAGRTWKAIAAGRNTEAAAMEGLIALGFHYGDFDPKSARLVAAVQVR